MAGRVGTTKELAGVSSRLCRAKEGGKISSGQTK
jgi:hypothetical protein